MNYSILPREQKINLSVCLVVHNEGKLVRRCLDSVAKLADEIIVVHDGPCQDDTINIAQTYGARIIIAPRSGVAELIRHLSFQAARGEWILQIDADEYLSDELRTAIPELTSKNDIDAYECIWPLYNGQRYITKKWPYKRCLFRRSAISFIGLPNYIVEVKGYVEKVPLLLEHRPQYNNYLWKTFKSKWLPWARIQAELCFRDFAKVPKFQYLGIEWPRNSTLRRRFSIFLAPIDAAIVFVKTLFSGGFYEGFIVWKVALLHVCFRVAVDWFIFKKKLAS